MPVRLSTMLVVSVIVLNALYNRDSVSLIAVDSVGRVLIPVFTFVSVSDIVLVSVIVLNPR